MKGVLLAVVFPSCQVYSPCLGDQPELQQRFERAKKSQEELLSRSNGNDASPDVLPNHTETGWTKRSKEGLTYGRWFRLRHKADALAVYNQQLYGT